MKRWPTEPVQPRTPAAMSEFGERSIYGGVICCKAGVQEPIGAKEHTTLLCRKFGRYSHSHCAVVEVWNE